jgi:hypothetical protein
MRYLAITLIVSILSTVCIPNTSDTNAILTQKISRAGNSIATSVTVTPQGQTQPVQPQSAKSDSDINASILHNIVVWLSEISDVIWAAVIASGLTLSGVTLSNRANRKCLLMQLNHAAEEKNKERELQIRKDVYMEAAEAVAESIKDIQLLPNRIIHTDNLEVCNKLLQALAKVHMVGTLDTVKNTTQFMEKFNQSTLPIIPEITKFAILKQELAGLNNVSNIKISSMKEINRNFEQMDSSSKQTPGILEVYKNTFQSMKTEHDTTIDSIMTKEGELKSLHTKLLTMCLKASIYLQKESLYVILSIRKELNLEIDSTEYLSRMEEMFKKSESSLTQENIEKLLLRG